MFEVEGVWLGGGGGGIELICLFYMWAQFWVLRVHSTATRLQVTHVHDTADREPSVPHGLMFTVWGQRQ